MSAAHPQSLRLRLRRFIQSVIYGSCCDASGPKQVQFMHIDLLPHLQALTIARRSQPTRKHMRQRRRG
jgi:hypothetical protein